MKLSPVTNDDLFELSELEEKIFGQDCFGVYVLHDYLKSHIFFDKIYNLEKNELIGFYIVTKLKKDKDSAYFFNHYDAENTRVAHLDNLVLDKNYWGQGYGTKIVDYLIKKLVAANYKHVLLEVNTSNARAINLYKKFGFEIFSEISDYYSSGGNAYYMLKII